MVTPQVQSKLWLDTGLMVFFGSSIDAQAHSHNAIQITWPIKKQSLILNGNEINTACIIAANQSHSLSLEQGWILLIEPQSSLGELISQSLTGQNFKLLDLEPDDAQIEIELSASIQTVLSSLKAIWQAIDIELSSIGFANSSTHLDRRINQLVQSLDQCFISECVKPESWLAEAVAQSLALSESRFLHLFKQEMKIAWRPYLLWRRLLCAANVIQRGRSATEAAHIAGFSDSAHLSRTFKKMFGTTIRQAQQGLFK